MAKVTSNELVVSAQAAQREAVSSLETPPHIAIVRLHDPVDVARYKPTASYAAQIRNHAATIGVESSETIIWPDQAHNIGRIVGQMIENPRVTGIMPLYPFGSNRRIHEERAEAVKQALAERPEMDIDDLLGRDKEAPTARAMLAMGNVCLHKLTDPDGDPYFVGRTIDELAHLDLAGTGVSGNNIRIGGRGDLTGKPLIDILHSQGLVIGDEQVATGENPSPLQTLPRPALVFTATPVAEQISNESVPSGSVIIDAGFGIVDGVTYGNASREIADRSDVLWTPPREGVGPVSTVYLFDRLLETAGVEASVPLGHVALDEMIDYVS